MRSKIKRSFDKEFSSWKVTVASQVEIDWAKQLRILNEVADLITPDLGLEDIIRSIYLNVNHIIDAFQFAVGIYDERAGVIYYRGMIEDGKNVPDFAVDAFADNRFASWCIRQEEDIFMNDIEKEYIKYLKHHPTPLAGSDPKAAIYVPLKLYNKVVGLITVRTIRKNVYLPHHLYVLKTVGNFVVRALELTHRAPGIALNKGETIKKWRWCTEDDLPSNSRNLVNLLTEREKEVLLLMVTGLSNKALAERLFVSPATIKTHTLNIYQKLDVGNRTAATLKAIESGWVV